MMKVPFFRPDLGEAEIDEVVATLRSGWLTTGPRVEEFEREFAAAVGGRFAVALNSCTAALHLATEALHLERGQAVLVPTMTFAATAEVVRYSGAIPILFDCDPITLNPDFDDAERKIAQLQAGELPVPPKRDLKLAGIIPVHVGGLMVDLDRVHQLADGHGLWVVEDAAHAFPAAWRPVDDASWQRCGENSAEVTCYSFYANKTITTGEGGMAVTDRQELAERMRMMSLHGLSRDAWGRHSGTAQWDYRILAPGFKYNFTDIAAALGIHQLRRAEAMRRRRQEFALRYRLELAGVEELELPPAPQNRLHAWHLFPIRLHLDRLSVDRNRFVDALAERGIAFSVHWRPLHLHPYYRDQGWAPEHLPTASRIWERLVTLPLFSAMTGEEIISVIAAVKELCTRYRRRRREDTTHRHRISE